MAIFPATAIPSGAEDFTIDQSLKFDNSGQHYLSRTPAANGNRRTWTMSYWVKYTSLADHHTHFGGSLSGSASIGVMVQFDGGTRQLLVVDYRAGYQVDWSAKSNAGFRDPSAWYHIVIAVDTTQGTDTNRVKLYANGELLTLGTYNAPSENFETKINQNNLQIIGGNFDNEVAGNFFGGYLAEMHFIDGQQLTPTSFGETGDYGEWKPKEVSGVTYGTNGFYLPFKQDYTVEGFSTVTWKGNGVDGHYIGGTGFKPSLTWVKERNGTEYHNIVDAVRGSDKLLFSNVTNAEVTDGNRISALNNDGFSLGTDSAVNTNGDTYVAWNWDMGGDSYGVPSTIEVGGNTNHSTTQEKIGDTSIRFDGTDDYLAVPDSSDWDFGTNDFTIEGWVRFDATGSSEMLFSRSDERVGSSFRTIYIKKDTDDTLITRYGSGGSWVTSENASTETFAANTWYHIAVTRQNDSFSTYLNGTRLSSMDETSTVDIQGDTPFLFGANYGSSWGDEFTGYMDEIRISNKCRYTSNFTAPTTAFSNDANTTLLIHSDTTNGSTTFVDSSGAALNENGSIDSYVAANPTYGQSIVSYTGTGSNATVGHGLSGAPEMVIVKHRNSASYSDWTVYHASNTAAPETDFLQLNDTSATSDDNERWNDTAPTADVFSVGVRGEVNGDDETYIAYCFDSVSGYSKVGEYTGNGGTKAVSGLGFKPAWIMIKCTSEVESWNVFDNTRNPTNPVILNLNPNVSNAESDASSGDRHIQFDSDGFSVLGSNTAVNGAHDTYIYMAFADTREYAYWLDQSGNNNDWTSNNLTESDISVDSPTNNFCTLNPLDKNGGTLSEGNLKLDATTSWIEGRSTLAVSSGKWYYEVYIINSDAFSTGLRETGHRLHSGLYWANSSFTAAAYGQVYGYGHNGTTNYQVTSGSNSSFTGSTANGDVLGFEIDLDSGTTTLKWNKNGVAQTTLYSSLVAAEYAIGWESYDSDLIFNFGQDSSFAGALTAQGNQDSNDIGDFYYEPPTGFLALCTSNLPAVAVTPSEHFNTVLYTGTGSAQDINLGMDSDFTWVKSRGATGSHALFDSLRKTGSNYDHLSSNSTNAESSTSYVDDVSTVFGLTGAGWNTSSATYVAWNWKANGSGSSNTDGTINTTATSANVDAGFSISTYTGTGSAATIGHGLSKAPEMFIVKQTESGGTGSGGWNVFVTVIDGSMDELTLNNTSAKVDRSETLPTSSVISIGTSDERNYSGIDYIAYCFHSVDGYSKVGSYNGNGNADGTFVYTGFRPAYVMVKRYDTTKNWFIQDNKRESYNPTSSYLVANDNSVESVQTDLDFLSNGFKCRSTGNGHNNSSGTYLYWAFAETPFKYSNAL